MTFKEDLEYGVKFEEKVLEIVEHTKHWKSPTGSKEYDIATQLNDDEPVYWESKSDRRTIETGNIVIEFQCRGKPSGITTTAADYWIYFIEKTNKYLMIPTSHLREVIDAKKYKRIVNGGDDGVALMYLFPYSDFLEYEGRY